MKIIHIVHGKANPNSANGISRVVYYLNKYEKLSGVDSQIWALVDGIKEHRSYKRDEFVTVECFPRVRTFGNREIIKALNKERHSIDLIHFHLIWFYDKNIIAKELKKLGIPFIITTHGTYSNPHAYTGKRLLAKWLFELKYLKMANECHILTPEEGTGLKNMDIREDVLSHRMVLKRKIFRRVLITNSLKIIILRIGLFCQWLLSFERIKILI